MAQNNVVYAHYRNLTVTIRVGALQGNAPNYAAAVPITCHVDDFTVNVPSTRLNQAGRCDDLHREVVVSEQPVLTMACRVPSDGFAVPIANGSQVIVTAQPGPGIAPTAYEGIVVERGHASPMGQFQTQTLTVSINGYADVE